MEETHMRKLGLTSKILIGLFLGMLFGVILSKMPGSYIKDTVLLGGIDRKSVV